MLTIDASARAHLILPLSRHDLGIGAGDLNASVETCLVVRLHDVSAHDLAGSVTAVVRALRSRESVLWPAVWPSEVVEEGVFLLETEPELVLGVLLHQNSGVVAVVVGVWRSVRHPRLAHYEHVVPETEWIRVHRHWTEVDIGVVARCLTGGGPIEVPF